MLLKRIDGFENYFVCYENCGIWSEKTGKFLKLHLDSNGYYHVVLYKNETRYTKLVHRLIADCFIENPENLPEIDHINRIKTNNRIENLRWATSQNNSHNKNNNSEHLNIQSRENKFQVKFLLKYYKICRTFDNLEKALEFRDIIQQKNNEKEQFCKFFVELFDNDEKYIYKTNSGNYQIKIKKPNLKICKNFKTIDEAKEKRNDLLKIYYS